MSRNRCSRCVNGYELNGHVDCGHIYLEIQDGAFVPVNPLDAKKLFDPEMFLIENLAESGVELREMTLESNDVLSVSNLANGTIDVVNFIGINKVSKPVKSAGLESVKPENSINVEPSVLGENKN